VVFPLADLAIDATGTYMTTAGVDGRVSIWDLRMYKTLQTYYTKKPVETVSVSQRGLLATGYGNHIQIWKDHIHQEQKEPYMTHNIPFGGRIRHLSFVPFDDVLGIGHDAGYSSILIPGAGEANYDTFEANPFETKKQRREVTVTRLLEKLQPEMITLDPQQFGVVTKSERERHQEDLKVSLQANAPGMDWAAAKQEKRKKRGAKKRKTQQNVVDKRRVRNRSICCILRLVC
jgi:U3 small nucleolar RNA-associated protein 7